MMMRARREKFGLWYTIERWGWCDALYMAPPVWTGLWKVTGEEKYLNYMVQEWKQTTEWLWDADESLYYRDRAFIGKPTPSGKKNFWARGNGWVLAGLAEVLQYLPKDRPEYSYFENTFKVMAAKLKSIQKENGTWAMSLIDPEFFPQDETSGTAFFTYGLAWGVNNGLLNRAEYEPVVRKGWKALCERQLENGRLINVQPEGHAAVEFDPDSTVIFGMGTFISAGSEVYKLVSGGQK
jgi:rhamnogalacturonyl hydrolase YesR